MSEVLSRFPQSQAVSGIVPLIRLPPHPYQSPVIMPVRVTDSVVKYATKEVGKEFLKYILLHWIQLSCLFFLPAPVGPLDELGPIVVTLQVRNPEIHFPQLRC
jgi:hypothetical protein